MPHLRCTVALAVALQAVHILRVHSKSAAAHVGPRPREYDHRVLLHPGVWKIRARESGNPKYFAYHFAVGSNCTALKVHYPRCSQVACRGLPASHSGCDKLCSSGTWLDASAALDAAWEEFDLITASIHATLSDLTALSYDRALNPGTLSAPVAELLRLPPAAAGRGAVDVMARERALCESALARVNPDSPGFAESLSAWKSGAFRFAVQLNAVTFALHGAHGRLVSCLRALRGGSDVSGCRAGLNAEHYTESPVAVSSSSSALVLVVRREPWHPLVLSRWYMPFADASRGNRLCWLDRPMLSDERSNYSSNYRVPPCDASGVCGPLELDETTVPSCDPDGGGEVGPGCPLVCDAACFGPLCYRALTDDYALRTWYGSENTSAVLAGKSPRTLSEPFSLSAADLRAYLLRLTDKVSRFSEALRRGEGALQEIIKTNATLLTYVDLVRAATSAHEASCDRLRSDEERAETVAVIALLLSLVTVCLSIVACVKKLSPSAFKRRRKTLH